MSNRKVSLQTAILFVGLLSGAVAFAGALGAYYSWGQGQDGYGHCYQYAENGGVLNEGQPQPDYMCGAVTYSWGQGQDGWGHCYEYGGGFTLNAGQPAQNYLCSATTYAWGSGQDGYTHCYQYGGGFIVNGGQPVENYYCGG